MKFVSLFLLIFISEVGYSQSYHLKGKVVDENNQPLSYVTVLLAKFSDDGANLSEPHDSKGTTTNDNGTFEFLDLEPGSYRLSASFIGFKTHVSTFKISEDTVLAPITLPEDAEALDQITITAKRPTIVRKPDRLTFNIENTALTEGSTLQVLRSTPGIIVQNGSINIKSSAATIYINNRRVQLNPDELLQLLESAPANSIKSVDVITNPPASYDADSGPVVNIIMTKNLIAGYRGSVSTNYTQGVFPRYNGAMSHYFKNDKINFNLNYSYTNQKINRNEHTGIDFLDTNNNIDEVWQPSIVRETDSETHNINLNFDYYLSDKTNFSVTSTGLFVPYFKYNLNNNTVINDANFNFQSRFTADNLTRDDKLNIGTDVELNTNFKNESSLRIAGHYTVYDFDRDQNVDSRFFDGNNIFTNASEFNTVSNQDTNILSAKVDYSLPIGDSASFDAGTKYSNIKTESNIVKFDVINGNATIDPTNSNAFDYDEHTYAAYVNYNQSWEKWDLTLGIRAEQTNLEGFSPTLNQTNTQDYFEWFPNASLSHNISDNLMVFGNYKRSITRPNYTDLNPFTFFLNENLTVVGNPALQPTITDYFSFGINFLEHFTVSFYRSESQDTIYEIPRQDNNTNILAYTPVNIDKVVDYGFDFEVDYSFTNNWNVYVATSFYNVSEQNNFQGQIIDLDRWANYTTLSNTMSFLEDNSLNLNLNITWVGRNLIGLTVIDNQLFSDLSISKSLWNNRGVISLSVQDIFNMQDQQSVIRYLNQSSRNDIDLDNRFVRVGFRYKFGNTKLSTNERTTDIDERDRIKDLN